MMSPRDRKPSETSLDRRSFLSTSTKIAASLAVASSLPSWARAEASSKLAYPFTLGVASGDPLPNAVVIWTRLAPSPLEPTGGMSSRPEIVFWQVARDENFRRIERAGVTFARAERGHSVHIDVRGLDAARTYFYRFWAGGHFSPVGRTRTAPDFWRGRDYDVRFAFASCQHFEQGFYTAYKHMAEEDLDFVVFVGDYIYEGTPVEGRPRRHNDGGEPITIEGYRQRYGLYKGDPHLQLAHARFPWIVTWDDHEVDNDYSDEIPQDPALQSRDAFLARRAAAYQAYWEHMPLRSVAEPDGPNMQLYRRLSYGSLEINVLDTRQYRSITKPCGGVAAAPLCDAALEPSRTILGQEQESWLFRGLDRSRARWNVLAQQVPVAFTDVGQGAAVEVRQDKWDAYPVARQRLVEFLSDRKVSNPVVLTGDLHNAWLTVVNRDPYEGEEPVATELTATSITSGGDGTDQSANAPTILAKNPHVLFHSNRRGYISCEINEQSWTSHYRVVPYVTTEGAPLQTARSFVIESGDPTPYPA